MWKTEQNWRIYKYTKFKLKNQKLTFQALDEFIYRIDKLTHWTFHVVHMVDHLDRSKHCPDYFQPMRKSFRMVWIDSQAHYSVWSLPFQMTLAIIDTNLCHTHAMWCFWWCVAGKWIHRYRSNDYRRVLSNVANIQHRCICQWYRIWWHRLRQRKLLHDPIEIFEKKTRANL